jgi:hypothetical protein
MSTVSRSFDVTVSPEVAIPYLADFSNAVDWDPGTVKCDRTDTGPVAIGATWHNTSKIAGISTELTYTLTQLTDRQVVLVGVNKTATSKETIDFARTSTGSRVTYTNDTEFNGAAKLAAPLVRLVFERLGNEVENNLVKALNALAV